MRVHPVYCRMQPRGSALFFGMVLVTLLAGLTLAFALRIKTNEMRMESDIAGVNAMEVAQAASNMKVQAIWSAYATQSANLRVTWLGGDSSGNGAAASTFSDADWVNIGYGQAKTTVTLAGYRTNLAVDLNLTTIARVKDALTDRWVTRKFERIVQYGVATADVFDFVYFANNYGWMYGSTIYTYGNMGANADIGFQSSPTVDGLVYAAANPRLGAAGVINGQARFDTLDQYKRIAARNPLMRPTNPTAVPEDVNNNGVLDRGEDLNGNGVLDSYPYDLGYTGSQQLLAGQDTLQMPYLGDLSLYTSLARSYARLPRPEFGEPAAATGGIVKQLKAPGLDPTKPENYNVLISSVYGAQAGQNGIYSTVSSAGVALNTLNPVDSSRQQANGNLALIGTPQQPIVIMGPVVVTNDLVIKGTITGQGTFYVGRNTHIVGDIVYANPPQWIQDDTHFAATVAANKTADAIGFATKGSVVLGRYVDIASGADAWGFAEQFMRPPFTKPYPVDLSDGVNGYITGYSNGDPMFNGDYTQWDGGFHFADAGNTQRTNRRFYESAFSDSYISSIASKPTTIHGIYYTNHYFGGRVNQPKFNGAMVTRDEGIIFDSTITMSYDPRISLKAPQSFVQIWLPQQPMYKPILWHEIPAVE